MKKKVLMLILTAAALVSVLAVLSLASHAETFSGSCGEYVRWELNSSTGVLKITGKGKMNNFLKFGAPWYQSGHGDSVKTVIIGDGVTSISEYFAWGCVNLSRVTIGKDVKTIYGNAFSTAHLLTSIVIPDSVTGIASSAFDRCDGLKTVTLGSGLKTIDGWAFSGCSSLKKIVIPDSVTTVGYYAFKGCTSLTSVVIGNGVTVIDEGAFSGCTALSSVSFGKNVRSIGDMAFSGCKSLKKVIVPEKVTRLQNVFSNCSGLESATLHDGITELWGTFCNCASLKSIKLGGNLETIGPYTFEGCSSLKKAVIPDSVTEIYQGAFKSCTSLEYVSIGDGVNYIQPSIFEDCTSLTAIDFGKGLTSVGERMFAGCTGLKCLALPETVLGAQKEAFCGCTSLRSVSIINGFNVLAESVFARCSELRYINLPASLKSVWEKAFYGCNNLSDVYYTGTEQEWKEINIRDNNKPIIYAKKHYGSIPNPFSDVPYGKWFTTAVLYNYKNGLMSGTSYGAFSPNTMLTRAMFVTILAKIDGADLAGYTGTSFSDVKEGKWYSKPIQWAVENGYANGTGNGMFGTDLPLTREALARFLYTYSEKKGFDVSGRAQLSSYSDADYASEWAKEPLAWAVDKGLISGTTETTLSPKGFATRAQVALIVMNFVKDLA